MAITIHQHSKEIENGVEEIYIDNMPLNSKIKGANREEPKEDILASAPSKIDQEREQLLLPSLYKALIYRLPIPPMCHPREDNGVKLLELKDPRSFMVNITIRLKKTAKAMLDLGTSINIMPYSVYL